MKKILLAVCMLSLIIDDASAYTLPQPGSFMFVVSDFLMNYVIRGPVGFVGGVICIAMGFRQWIHYNYGPSGPPHFGLSAWVPLSSAIWWFVAVFLLKADDFMISLGTVI